MPRYDVRDREYYTAAKAGDADLVVSAPFHGRAAGGWGFTVSRARITNGHFDGVAAVTLLPSYFRHLYQTVLNLPERSTVLLLRQDGTVLARFPDDPAYPRQLSPDTPTMRIAAVRRNAVYDSVSPLDDRAKLRALRWLPGWPVMVVSEIDFGGALQPWYVHVALFAGFAFLAALALALTAFLALRRAEREQSSLQALIVETQRRQQAEAALQQAQKIDALGRLTGGVAHDFNNMLTTVLGSLELALRRVIDPTAHRLISAATTAAQRGAKLTSQMLAFAREQALVLQPVDPNSAVRDMEDLLRRSIGPLVRLDYHLEPDVWAVMADRTQLELAVLNLVVNAQDAMPVGGGVAIATRNLPNAQASSVGLPPRDHVAVSVSDTGEGMTETVRAAAFEPFFTTKPPGKGTGLGLSMVYGFARQTGGTVSLESAPAEGTRVTLYLPRAEAAVAVTSDSKDLPMLPLPLRVLLVEDGPAPGEPTAALLREIGCEVADVDGGSAALDWLRGSASFDVLLVDFIMPQIGAAQLAVAAKELRPSLPIVFLTDPAETRLLDHWQALGIQVVTKPFQMKALVEALHRAVRNATRALAEAR